MSKAEIITLGYGSGGELYHRLVEEVFLPIFNNQYLRELGDSSICPISYKKIAITTDNFVVEPLFFPGGDIGRLAVSGTVNDLSMSGAKPLYLTLGMIIEEGFEISELKKICHSIAETAKEANVLIVTGDTKVVEQGACDGIYINTSGVGVIENNRILSSSLVVSGDKIIISGEIACHGMAIMAKRHALLFDPPIKSDVAPLNSLAKTALTIPDGVKLMRDPTRGGIASTLNEWVDAFNLPIIIEENAIPLSKEVAAACELLGIDPFYTANEGKLLAIVSKEKVDKVISVIKAHPLGKKVAIIGEIGEVGEKGVFARTHIGSKRLVEMIDGEQLPRIC